MNPEHPGPRPDNEHEPIQAETVADRERQLEDGTPQKGREDSPSHPQYEDSDLSPAEREEKEIVRREVKAALESLHTELKTQERPGDSRITAAIDQTYLQQLTPIFKNQLATAIEIHQLQTKNQEAFVQQGLKILDFWIHLQGLKRGTNRDLRQLRTNFKAA